MGAQLAELRVIGEDKITPDPGGIIQAFSRIGYKLTEAVADIVDNSIDARARNVLIRFFCTDTAIRRIAVVDDGHGMTELRLLQAMQFGAVVKHSKTDLGKYGIGMKSASFSQCRSLSVLSRGKHEIAARRWTVENIRRGWACARLHTADAEKILEDSWGSLNLSKHGTVVLWDELDRLSIGGLRLEQGLRKLFGQLQLSLGMVFHRFLSRKTGLRITIDALRYDSELKGIIPQPVTAVDPFAYVRSGSRHYPKTFHADLGDGHRLELEAHVWPPRSKEPEYKLGGSAAARQGFFFYRNHRLIQAGGWNKMRQESEPHLSLARVRVELPPALDSLFHLDVQKSSLDVPATFENAVRESKAGNVSFTDFLADAQKAYRHGEDKAPKNAPLVLGAGVSREVRSKAKRAWAGEGTRHRKIKFKWVKLSPEVFFELDRAEQVIKLNSTYRRQATGKRQPSARDGGLVKTMLFLLLRDEFNRERLREERRKWIADCNALILAALRNGE